MQASDNLTNRGSDGATWVALSGFRHKPVILKVLFITAAMLACIISLISTPSNGAALTPDSIHYMSAAASLGDNAGWLRYDGGPFTHWPPLYPTVLWVTNSLLSPLRVDLVVAARLLQAFLYGAAVFLSGLLAKRHLRSPLLVALATVAVAAHAPLYQLSLFVLSELLFIVLILVFILIFAPAATGSWRWLIALTVIGALAALQRYTGVALIGLGAVGLMLYLPGDWRRKLGYSTLFIAASSAPLTLWLARNYALTSTLTGNRGMNGQPFETVLGRMLDVIDRWFDPTVSYPGVAIALTLVGLGVITGFGRLWNRQTQQNPDISTLLAIFAVGYAVLLAVMATITSFDEVNLRLMSPMFVSVVLLAFVGVERLQGWLGRVSGRQRLASNLAALCVSLWLLYPVGQWIGEIQMFSWCCRYDEWRDSNTIGWLRDQALRGPVYSNTTFPIQVGIASQRAPKALDDLITQIAAVTSAHFVWVDHRYRGACGPDRRFCYTPDYQEAALVAHFTVEVVAVLDDGRVYLLRWRQD